MKNNDVVVFSMLFFQIVIGLSLFSGLLSVEPNLGGKDETTNATSQVAQPSTVTDSGAQNAQTHTPPQPAAPSTNIVRIDTPRPQRQAQDIGSTPSSASSASSSGSSVSRTAEFVQEFVSENVSSKYCCVLSFLF